jgi:hypothetical protein
MKVAFKKLALGSLVFLGLSTAAAMATPMTTETYNISGTFVNGEGSFSGVFTASGILNGSNVFTSGTVTAANITVTSNVVGAYIYASIDYGNPSGNYSIAGTLQQDFFQVSTLNMADNFRVYFTNLSTTGATVTDGSSYDGQLAAGQRLFASASITPQATAVPEPSSIAVLGSVLVMIGAGFVLRRNRQSLIPSN